MKKITIVFITFFYFSGFGQNKLNTSKKELSLGSSSQKQSNVSNGSSKEKKTKSSDDSNVDFELVKVAAEVLLYATYGVFKYGIIGDYHNENHLYSNLTPYPFYNGKSGNFEKGDTLSITKNKARLDIENSFVYNSNTLFGNHLKVKIRPFQYFYLQTDFHQLFEFDKIDNTNSRFSLFQFNINYDRIRFEKFNFGWNLGATYVGNEVKKGGFAYGLNAEYFMDNRISIFASAKWCSINNAPLNTYELLGKFYRKNCFFSLGLEHLKMASPTYTLVALGGGINF